MTKVKTVELIFDVPVEISERLEQEIFKVLYEICGLYERQNPTRIMSPTGGETKSIWKKPVHDDSVLQLIVTEREDFYGRNPLNPDGERLRAESKARRTERKEREDGRSD